MADYRGASDDHLEESPEKQINSSTESTRDVHLLGEGSPGVRRIEIIASEFRFIDRIFLFCGIFLVAYVYGLDGTVRYTYQVGSPKSNPLSSIFQKLTVGTFNIALCHRKLWPSQFTRNYQRSSSCYCRRRSGNVFNTSRKNFRLIFQPNSAYCCQDCRCFRQS